MVKKEKVLKHLNDTILSPYKLSNDVHRKNTDQSEQNETKKTHKTDDDNKKIIIKGKKNDPLRKLLQAN